MPPQSLGWYCASQGVPGFFQRFGSVPIAVLPRPRTSPTRSTRTLAPFQVLSPGGRPRPTDGGWKDTLNLGAGGVARGSSFALTATRGRYVFHCHNLEHEDMAMMANFEVV